MLTAHLKRWFSRPPVCATSADRPRVAPAVAGRCVPRPSEAVPTVQVAISQTADGLLIQVKGEARVECASALQAGLLVPAAGRPAVVTLDLSELRSISSLAMGVLVAYRRGVVRTGGRVRLAEGLQPAVREGLARAELLSLFEPTAAVSPQAEAAPVLKASA
jgi:anti-anti-sigma factor